MLTGDATNADPVCSKSPHHAEVQAIVMQAQQAQHAAAQQKTMPILFRTDANSRAIIAQQEPAQERGG